jgi:glucosamine--fructose-6-phosphate aminotransferase (isomerizing)
MCGIIGIIGRETAAPQLVEALKRLEYRGYDSAGVATLEGGKLARRRAEGKLKNLESRLAREPLQGTIGIGHTRWATHGRPTENNAHPHATEKVAVVHNGIIENFAELRRELEQEGVKFSTDTDTEVIAHLVTEEMKHGASPVAAVQAALPRLSPWPFCSPAKTIFWSARAKARRSRSASVTAPCMSAPTRLRLRRLPTA